MTRISRTIISLLTLLLLIATHVQAEEFIPIEVRQGTNLTHLARDYTDSRDSWKEIAEINNISAPYTVYKATTILVPRSILLTEDLSAHVASLHGDVQLIQPNGEQTPLKKDDRILSGYSITTGPDSFVQLLLPDHKYTRIAPNSLFTINYLFRLPDNSVKADFLLKKGRITQSLKQKLKFNETFHTRTPVSLTAVRGTEFRLKMIDIETDYIETISGKVQVEIDGSSTAVTKGQGLQVAKGQPPTAPRPLPEIPPLPSLQPVYRTLPISFFAPDHKSAEYIRLRMCTDAEGNDTFLEMLAKPTEKFIIPTLADGTYYTFVTAIDSDKFESLPSESFVVKVRTIPSAPIISTPKDGLVTFAKKVDASWLGSPHVKSYNLQLSTNPDFTKIVDEQQQSTLDYQSPELQPGSYFLRVQGVAPDDFTTLYSVPIGWKITEQPSFDQMDASAASDLLFQWSAMAEKGTYDFQISKDSEFRNVTMTETGLPAPSYQITRQLSSGEYFVRVRGVLENGIPSQWTAPQSFTIEPGPWGTIGVVAIFTLLIILI